MMVTPGSPDTCERDCKLRRPQKVRSLARKTGQRAYLKAVPRAVWSTRWSETSSQTTVSRLGLARNLAVRQEDG